MSAPASNPVRATPGIEDLRRHFSYCPVTGVITWLIPNNFRTVPGSAAGTKNREGYIVVFLWGRPLQGHRIAWALHYGSWPSGPIDHINRQPSDNRIANLRVVTPSQNSLNRGVQSNNRLGVKGVYADKKGGYRAAITVNGKRHNLGRFDTIDQASSAYQSVIAAQEPRHV